MRVTIDIDGKGVLAKWKVALDFLVLKVLSRGNAYVRRSANNKFHLKAHGLPISFRTSLLIRALLGDDKMRIKFDLERKKKPKQILWSWKDGKYAGRWSKCLRSVLFVNTQ
ncbi:hypothetical protein J7J18_03695 [bacterium]|nr:hypothetical protein [bacterium]